MSAVGFDKDGITFWFDESLKRYLAHTGIDTSNFGPVTHWEFYEDWDGMTLPEFLSHCHDAADAGHLFNNVPPHHGSVEAMQLLKELGHTIHIITDRHFGDEFASRRNTVSWLSQYRMPYDTLTFHADKTIVETDYFIEDKIANYDALDAVGCKVYLFNRPWNQVVDDRRRINHIYEYVDAIIADSTDCGAKLHYSGAKKVGQHCNKVEGHSGRCNNLNRDLNVQRQQSLDTHHEILNRERHPLS